MQLDFERGGRFDEAAHLVRLGHAGGEIAVEEKPAAHGCSLLRVCIEAQRGSRRKRN
ncbi:MAG: hypothetical protein NVV62_14545 [Terricaulis sp.]|nr:hypothetical protein [Terricaulis sp.]